MKQLCIRFDEKTFETLGKNSENKALKLSEYVRRLVEIGLRVEQASSALSTENDKELNAIDELGEIKLLWENLLKWVLETRLLTRVLAGNLLSNDVESSAATVEKARMKSEKHVLELLNGQNAEGNFIIKCNDKRDQASF